MLIKQLKLNRLSKVLQNKAALALIALALLINTACPLGKRTPPLPPVERVPQRVEISGYQQGSFVNLSWTMPARNAGASSSLNISRVDVYRLAETPDSPLSLTEEEFASRGTLVAAVPISEDDFARKQITYQDALDFAGQSVRLRYAIRFVNAAGQKAAFSNFLLIEPAAKIASAPSLLRVEVTEEEILLVWSAPESNVDGSTPTNVLGFNIYRSSMDPAGFKLMNTQPVTGNQFADNFFEFDREYAYFVRAVSLGTGGEPVESLNSNQVTVLPRDTFPPSAPTAITIAAAPNNISIFFAINPERDIAGYRVYRTENPDLPKAEWRLLTKELLTTNTFQDVAVESGKTYYYYLTAVDRAGNVSPPSETVSDTVP
jgi:fibronectin type 3 domain-containing protein